MRARSNYVCQFSIQIGSQSDIDVLVYFDGQYQPNFSSDEDNILTGIPIEEFFIPGGESLIAIGLYEGVEPPYMKWTNFNAGRDSYGDVDPPLNGSQQDQQGNTPHTASVGASYDAQLFASLQKEYFSSTGGTQPIIYDHQGIPFETPKIFDKPNVVGPDVSLMLCALIYICTI